MSGIIFFIVFAIIILNVLSGFAKMGKMQKKNAPGGKNKRKNTGNFSSSPFLMVQKTKLNGVWMESAGEMGLSFLRSNENNPFPAIGGTIDQMQISVSLREEPGSGIMETHYKVLYPEDLKLDFYFVKAIPERMRIFTKGKKRWDKLDRELPEHFGREQIFLTAKNEKILESYLDKKRKEDLFWCLEFQEELFIDDRSVTLIYDGIDDSVENITARIRLVLQLARTFGHLSNGEKILYHRIPVDNRVKNPAENSHLTEQEEKKIFPTPAIPQAKKSLIPPVTPLPPLPKVTFPQRESIEKEEKNFHSAPAVENTSATTPATTPVTTPATTPATTPVTTPVTTPATTFEEKEACKEYKEEERKAEEIHSSGPEVAANLPETSCNNLLLTIDEITGKLFHASFAGNGEKEYFNTIKGKSVSWKGVLQSAYEYSSDFLFGSGGGVKAKFLLMEYKQEGSFLTRKIYAVVRFPREKSEFLRKNTGREFAFSGKIFHFESISKEIMLSDGILEK